MYAEVFETLSPHRKCIWLKLYLLMGVTAVTSTIPAMTVHLCAEGIHSEFMGWYRVVVHAAARHNQDSESGEEDDHSTHDFKQDKTSFVVFEQKVLHFHTCCCQSQTLLFCPDTS